MTFRDVPKLAVPVGLAILLSACVLSVNPVISDADSLHEPRLIGSWEEVSGSDRAVISLIADNRYAVEYTSDNKVGKFEARLGRLGEHLVLDAWPVKAENVKEGPDAGLQIPGHLLFVVDVGENETSVTILEPDPMRERVRAGDVRTPNSEDKGQLILTGTTEELRSALGPYLSRPGALSEPSVWRRAQQRALPVSPPCFKAAAWREADQLFRRDPHWVGADDAYSIDLGHDRILWLFADTWIDPSGRHTRRGARMIRNSVAIQTGADPSNATIEYYWGTTTDNQPKGLFTRQDDRWYWPGHGVRIEDRLILFLNRLRGTDTGLGFRSDGWNAVMVTNPDDEPSEWETRLLKTPSNQLGIIVGFASVLRWKDYIYAFGSQNSVKSHPIFAARWPIEKVHQGELMAPEWWADDTGWVEDSSSAQRWPLFENGQSELTIHVDEIAQQFLSVQSKGFGRADLMLRASPTLTGPWSKPRMIYRPPEYYRPNVMIYAAKAHPHLTGADLALTYATNTFEFGEHLTDELIYYPRFVRLTRCE